jgi:hypothetical protein
VSEDAPLGPELAQQVLKTAACQHCGGWHNRACPRTRRMVWHPNGTLAEVEFWPDGRWSDEYVIWPEQLTAEEVKS